MSVSFLKYLSQFAKNVDNEQTHLSFNNGKYNVPDTKYEEFYRRYYNVITDPDNDERDNLYLIEKVYNSKFAYFIDLDVPKDGKNDATEKSDLTDLEVKQIIDVAVKTIKTMFVDVNATRYVVSKRDTNYHINFYNLVVDDQIAKRITNEILQSDIRRCIDSSVYRTGLRLIGSKKMDRKGKSCVTKTSKTETGDTYRIYDLDTATYVNLVDMTYESFRQTVVRRLRTVAVSQLTATDPNAQLTTNEPKQVPIKGINNDAIQLEIARLLSAIRNEYSIFQRYDTSITRIYAKPNVTGMFCYYVSISGKYCPFKCREHARNTSPIYFEINMNKIYMKCYDEECRRRVFPDQGIPLPDGFETVYPQMYLSMTTRYWNPEVTLTDETRSALEASLSGSHYQIAKAVFQIYKTRFRVDDIRNTEWYEFEGVRWKRSHLMNILISEELPKYYRSIKISDTSVQNNNLQEYLVNNEKIDANVRNQMVDTIISKLENMSFKNNILAQLVYLFKTHDPDFYVNLDSKPNLVGFRNGVYDFERSEFRSGTQQDCITFSTGYDYIDYDPKCEHVIAIYEFLSKIIPDRRVLEYTLKVLGKSLVGMPDERFYIWTGLSGANGKSTLVNFLEHTLGDYITSVDVSLLTNKRAGSSNASPDVVRLRGKRIFTFQEPEHDDKLRTGILKQYSGGDTIIARELFKAPITFKLQGTMIMCCNDLPSVTSCDGGTWRRIRVVEFKSRFCDNPVKPNEFRIDPTIKTKIRMWRPYFMSILIYWYNKFLLEGMNEPEEVRKATNKYKVDNDKFNEFFDQVLEETDGTFEQNKTIYSHFSNWWSNNYPNSKIPDIKDLRRAMKIKYGNEKESMVNGCLAYGFHIRIRHTAFNDYNDAQNDDLD